MGEQCRLLRFQEFGLELSSWEFFLINLKFFLVIENLKTKKKLDLLVSRLWQFFKWQILSVCLIFKKMLSYRQKSSDSVQILVTNKKQYPLSYILQFFVKFTKLALLSVFSNLGSKWPLDSFNKFTYKKLLCGIISYRPGRERIKLET